MTINTADSRVAAQAVHDLGAALWFGGSVMGVAGVNKSGADLSDGVDKVRVAESAWRRFAPVQWLGIGAVLVAGSRLTWRARAGSPSSTGSGARVRRQAAVAVAGAAATGFAAWSGNRIGRSTERANERGERVRHEGRDDPERADPAGGRRMAAPPARRAVPGAGAGRRNIVLNAYLTQHYRPGVTAAGIAAASSRPDPRPPAPPPPDTREFLYAYHRV